MKAHTLTILGTAALVILSACEKFSSDYNGSAISFKTGAPAFTKVAYGEDVDKYQMIDWIPGDKITIAAKYARAGSDYSVGGPSSYSYSIASVTKDKARHYSIGKLNADANGLHWCPEYNGAELKKTSDEFWAYYSTVPVSGFTGGVSYDGSFSASIPQNSASEIPPILVAHTRPTSDASGKTISLYFNPAFTAFRVTLNNASGKDINLDAFGLSSQKDYLAGSFSASISGIDTDATVQIGSISGGARSISGSASGSIANGSDTTFYMFALPQTYSDLKIACSYTPAGGSQMQKTMDISSHTFEACKQHRMLLTINEDGEIKIEISSNIVCILAEFLKQNQSKLSEYLPDGYNFSAIYGIDRNGKDIKIRGVLNGENNSELILTEDMMRAIGEKVISLDCMNTNIGLSGEMTTDDFNFFTNLKDLRINLDNVTSVNLEHLQVENFSSRGNPTELNIQNCPNLKTLDCGEYNSAKTVSIGGCSLLETVKFNGNLNNARELKITDCPKLKTIQMPGNYGNLQKVVFDNIGFEEISITGGQNNFTEFYVNNCPNFKKAIVTFTQNGSGAKTTVTNSCSASGGARVDINCQNNNSSFYTYNTSGSQNISIYRNGSLVDL